MQLWKNSKLIKHCFHKKKIKRENNGIFVNLTEF